MQVWCKGRAWRSWGVGWEMHRFSLKSVLNHPYFWCKRHFGIVDKEVTNKMCLKVPQQQQGEHGDQAGGNSSTWAVILDISLQDGFLTFSSCQHWVSCWLESSDAVSIPLCFGVGLSPRNGGSTDVPVTHTVSRRTQTVEVPCCEAFIYSFIGGFCPFCCLCYSSIV